VVNFELLRAVILHSDLLHVIDSAKLKPLELQQQRKVAMDRNSLMKC
jgi:hypothetical protein